MNIVLKQNKYSLAFGETERKEAMAKQTRNKNFLLAVFITKMVATICLFMED